jgi:hypothetical protein
MARFQAVGTEQAYSLLFLDNFPTSLLYHRWKNHVCQCPLRPPFYDVFRALCVTLPGHNPQSRSDAPEFVG